MNRHATGRRTLDELAATAAEVDPQSPAVSSLASTVLALERAAGVSLGPADDEPLVVLQRRFGRVHRSLAGASIGIEELERLTAALRGPSDAPDADARRAAVRPSTVAALAEC